MKTRIFNLWDQFRESFWFVPVLLTSLAALTAIIVNAIDHHYAESTREVLFWTATDPASARSALSAIASAMLTLVGVIFSLTMVAVSTASSQYGSRLLRSYMADSLADYVMGTFLGTGIFCLITLRSIRESNADLTGFTPHLSVGIGVSAGLFSIALLVYFIHDVATSIQAPHIVRTLASDLNEAIERLYPQPMSEEDVGRVEEASPSGRGTSIAIASDQEGYVEGIDLESLVAIAVEHDGLLHLDVRPGHFVIVEERIAEMHVRKECDEQVRDTLISQVRSAFVVGSRRTPRQDIVCSIMELVDIAVRSLSPGVNDPFTAMNCIDRLAAGLAKLAQRQNPCACCRDDSNEPRVLWNPVTCVDAIHDAFRQIRQYGASSVAVSIRIIEALTTIAQHAKRKSDREALWQQAQSLREVFLASQPQALDQRDFAERFEKLVQVVADCDIVSNELSEHQCLDS